MLWILRVETTFYFNFSDPYSYSVLLPLPSVHNKNIMIIPSAQSSPSSTDVVSKKLGGYTSSTHLFHHHFRHYLPSLVYYTHPFFFLRKNAKSTTPSVLYGPPVSLLRCTPSSLHLTLYFTCFSAHALLIRLPLSTPSLLP